MHNSRPRRIQSPHTIQQIGLETLIYDETRHQAFCLNPLAGEVWKLADGTRTAAEIAAATTASPSAPVTEQLVLFTLTELRRDGLVEAEPQVLAGFVPATLTRRQMIERLGLSSAVLLPVIVGIAAPKAAQAYSGCFNCPASQRRKNNDAEVDREIDPSSLPNTNGGN